MSQPRARAQDLHREALAILHGGLLDLIEARLGHVEIAGSVALDMMAVPDIDLYVRLEGREGDRMLDLLPDLSKQLSTQGYALAKLIFNNEHIVPDPNFPDSPGLYSGLTFAHRATGMVWKLDLWGWDTTFYDLRHRQHKELEAALLEADRDMILHLKELDGYGSAFSSIDVYTFALGGAGKTDADSEQFLLRRVGNDTP